MTFDNIKQAHKRSLHFAPPRTTMLHKLALLTIHRKALPSALTAIGAPNALLLWEASDDYRLKLQTLDDIARCINRFIDTHRAANHMQLIIVLRWWRSLLFFDPKQL